MFKQLRDGWRQPKISRAMLAAHAAIAAGELTIAENHLTYAYNLLLDTTLGRMHLINMITTWGLTATNLTERGRSEFAEQCSKMAKLLQAKFDAGDYYRDQF